MSSQQHLLRSDLKGSNIPNIETKLWDSAQGSPSSGNVQGSSTTSACQKWWNKNRMKHCSLRLPSLGSSETNGNTIEAE